MAKKLDSFTVMAKLQIECTLSIKAESLEDAIEKSRGLKETDFVDIHDDFNDGSIRIVGVYEGGRTAHKVRIRH